MAKSALGRGLGDLMEAASKSAPLHTNESPGRPVVSSLDQGFQTILETSAFGTRTDGVLLGEGSANRSSLGSTPLLTDAAARFAVKVLVAQDILLLTLSFMVVIGHAGTFGWIQVIVCSALVALGATCAIMAFFLAQKRVDLQTVPHETLAPSQFKALSKAPPPRFETKPR